MDLQPRGIFEQADLPGDQTRNLSAFHIILIFIAAGCMVMRVSSRKILNLNLERDDWTFLGGTVLAIGLFIVGLIYTFHAGLGAHWAALTPGQKELFPKLNYAYNILNLACYPVIKISILLLYLRIFTSARLLRKFCWAGVVFLSAMVTANTLVACFSCRPVRSFFDPTVTGKCINSVSFYWSTAILNVITDVYILILPMPVVWNLKIDVRRKIAISFIFMLGGLTFIVSILRIIYYFDYTATDPSHSFLRTAYATPAEVCLAILVASAPTWRPIWGYTSKLAVSFFRRLSSGASSFNFLDSHKEARDSVLNEKTNSAGGRGTEKSDTSTRKSSATYAESEMNHASSSPKKAALTAAGPASNRSQDEISASNIV